VKSKRKKKPGHHTGLKSIAATRYAVLSLVANIFGNVFWWAEQKRWRLADQLEQLEP
jgi:hypothetical protein